MRPYVTCTVKALSRRILSHIDSRSLLLSKSSLINGRISLERTATCRAFSSYSNNNNNNNRPPGGTGGGNNSPYRLRRPDMQPSANNLGGGGTGGGGMMGNSSSNETGGGQQQQQRREKVNIYANKTPYVPGVRGTRANAITLFPGDFQDYDNNLSDDDDDQDNSVAFDNEEDPEEVQWREYVKEAEEKAEAERLRRLELNKPIQRTSEIDERGRAYGRGGRKTAEARVWIQPGFGEVVVNSRSFTNYFERLTDREQILAPFVATETCGMFDVHAIVKGGGLSGQAGAIRLGVARALNAYNPDLYRPPLKLLGYLTRDPRKVERKKVGHVKARKSPQWVRR